MNFNNIINDIAESDPEVFDRTSMRRDVIKNWSRKVALTALPFALGSMFKKAYGKTTDTALIISTLNFALTLEYLEAEFYATGYAKAGLIPTAAAQGAIKTIGTHETAHVNFLKTAITASGGTPVAKPSFDFTGGKGVAGAGPFQDVFTNYTTFLAVAQAFEDTGVRAYKGQAGNLMESNDVLQAALQIHSVEARHASHIRQMRRALGNDIKPWITQAVTGIPSPAVNGVYAGEDLDVQATLTITGIGGTSVAKDAATEAFDEPLTKEAVLAIVTNFIVPQ